MAKILGRDPNSYAREKTSFLNDLRHFHELRGTPFRRTPSINGHEIDLYLLYCLVTGQGGWIKVNSRNEWPELFQKFDLPANCTNAGVGLKQLYLRYLDRWEKVHFLGEEADRGSDDDEESRHRRWSARALHSVPLSYNHQQHNVVEAIREYNNLSTDLYKQSDYDRLALSLLSPLPNEQDFAINVCTLLSNDGRHTLKLEKYPRIVDNLIAHTGIFHDSSLRPLITKYYNTIRQHPLNSFWKEALNTEEFLDLTDETNFITKKVTVSSTSEPNAQNEPETLTDSLLQAETLANIEQSTTSNSEVISDFNLVNDSECEICPSPDSSSDNELFNLKRALGTQDYVGQRILQIATILRNLSFIEENIPVLSKSETFLRFIILCSSSRWSNLHNLGLDMLGNVIGEYLIKDASSDRLSECLLKLISGGLQSEDRTFCIASLDALNKLSQIEKNEEILSKTLEPCVYQRVCSFLTIHDVMLLVYTLECLYSLTSLGERPCNLIVNIHGVVDTLVSLVTVEGKSYGPKACIGMKLVETVPGTTTAVTTQTTTIATPTTTSTPSVTTTATAASPGITTLSTISAIQVSAAKPTAVSNTITKATTVTPQRIIITPSSTVVSTTSTLTTTQLTQVITSQQLVQQQHAHQQAIQENEQFALAWLRATYEPQNNSRVDHQELYKHYINSCAKIGRRGVIAPLHFPRCVRSVFGGTVGPNPAKSVNAKEIQYYEGIKVRAHPLVINIQSVSSLTSSPIKGGIQRKGQNVISAPSTTSTSPIPLITLVPDSTDPPPQSPASPILKAQLSAPSKPRETTVVVSTPSYKGDTKSQVMAHPHLSQALLGTANSSATAGPSKETQMGQSNTSLIKSLLATKVNDCMTTIGMKNSKDCQSVVQVAARQQQQKLLAQQTTSNKTYTQIKVIDSVPKTSRINGARQLFSDEVIDTSVSSTTTGSNFGTGKREPPQPPPPPLAPLSNSNRIASIKVENDDSNSTGNNSLASSSGLNVGISSTEDGENSLTSFEGLLNGVPNIDNQLILNDDSNSKDSLKSVSTGGISKNKPLMLADLLEKKIDKDPPLLNGVLAKELRIGEKGLELVENHIDKILSRDIDKKDNTTTSQNQERMETDTRQGIKRSSSEDIADVEAKRPNLGSSGVNGCLTADSPAPDSVSSSSNSEEPTGTVSTAAAKLFADIAADILEDEEEELLQEAQAQQTVEDSGVVQVIQNSAPQQVFVDQPQQQQVIMQAQPRQIIVSQPGLQATNQVVLPAGTQLKAGQAVIVQNTAAQRPQMVLQQSNTGQFLLSQSLQGQMQLVASTTQPGQYVLQTGTQGAYVVAQSQTAMVHGQPQTVLVAQTAQQQGTNTKTIIILQQPNTGGATHHPKVMVTPQGQQVVVTQVQRPILHTATSINNIIPTQTIVRTTANTTVNQNNSSANTIIVEKKVEEPKVQKPKIIRDLTTPFVCEWGECQIDTKFKSANQVYLHVCAVHCPESIDELTCQWERCDNMKRKRFSLMTHIYDKHCNVEAMKQSQVKRRQQSQSGKVETLTTVPVTPHPGYAPDAALHAIKRHALEFVNPKELQQRTAKQGAVTVIAAVPRTGPPTVEQDDNEGPVTKSMRLTAALILRNLVIYSNNCKRYLRQYESHLANVALSNVESSRTVAQILYDMSEAGVSHR